MDARARGAGRVRQQQLPATWSFWRIRIGPDGTHYTAAYEDGDRSVKLFSSPDGITWAAGAVVYDHAEDTPLETELWFRGDQLLALVRMDGTDAELLGNVGRLRTKVCAASPPHGTFDCSGELDGVRLDDEPAPGRPVGARPAQPTDIWQATIDLSQL